MKAMTLVDPGYTFNVQKNNICKIVPEGKIPLELAAEISQRVIDHIAESGSPAGLLIDVRFNILLSIVRLSNLLDALGDLDIPLAVVFWNEQQLRLARLVHNTLSQQELVAYFTAIDQAERYLLSGGRKNPHNDHPSGVPLLL